MTRSQRKIHVLLWVVLGPLALLGLVMAVLLRPAVPVQDGPLPGVGTEQQADSQDDLRAKP